ncbi:MAG: hypothetical protein JO353_04500 [Phycisphaerae bacterium]|nr:hypothetical protein [Phycisphaerae bacterium]
MITAQSAISRFHRDLTLGVLVKMVLFGAVVASFVGTVLGWHVDVTIVLVIVSGVWIMLSMRAAYGSRLAAASPPLIAAGQFDAAEEQIAGALRSFSISRKVKLLSLHHLAVLRHAQRKWQDAAMLCRALLGDRPNRRDGTSLMRSARLMLAESLLELNDLTGTYKEIQRLHDPAVGRGMRLGEAMHLMLVQLDYESRIGAWASMMMGLTRKVELAELMPSDGAARTQSLLALAAGRMGRMDWANWLKGRAELLRDPAGIIADRPVVAELWGAVG